jgi:putative FmdB family regulatory protein
MPLYEFECQSCAEPFEELVRTSTAIKDVTCPNCGSHQVKKKLSTFAAKTGDGPSATHSPACAPGGA